MAAGCRLPVAAGTILIMMMIGTEMLTVMMMLIVMRVVMINAPVMGIVFIYIKRLNQRGPVAVWTAEPVRAEGTGTARSICIPIAES